MRRDAFGPFATLIDQDLARLLVLVGSGVKLGDLAAPEADAKPLPRLKHEGAITLNVRRIERFGEASRRRRAIGTVDEVAAAAKKQWERLMESGDRFSRVALDIGSATSDPMLAIDVEWLGQLVLQALPSDAGVIVLLPSAASSFRWDWPLETAVRGRTHGPSPLGAGFSYDRFLKVLDQPEAQGPCDLVLVVGSLTEAARQALDVRLEASLVVVLEGGVGDWHEAQALLQLVRSRWRAGAVAVCSVAPLDQAQWLDRFVEELTHNRSIDQALRVASETVGAGVPLLAGDGQFVALATLAETAKRIGRAITDDAESIRLQPPQVPNRRFSLPIDVNLRTMRDAGRALILNADKLAWDRESGDASALVELKEASARISGAPFVPARIDAGDLPLRPREVVLKDSAPRVFAPREAVAYSVELAGMAAVPARLTAPRWVQANIYGGSTGRRVGRVAPGSTYALEMFISLDKVAALAAPNALDESRLPASQSGHSLRIAFTPLWRAEGQQMHPPQVQRIHLPAGGASEKATFYFRTPQELGSTRARVVVLSGNRVLQTLMLAPKGAITRLGAQLTLSLESIVSADLGDQSVSPEFDASIVINDDVQGTIGLTVIAGEAVDFFEPAGVDKIVKNISTALGTLNTGIGSAGEDMGLDDPALEQLLLKLAVNGRSLYRAMFEQSALKALVQPRKIQFVEAVPKGYFPIELAYEGRHPTYSAKLCPNAHEALRDPGVHGACEHAASPDHHCPAAFWGFSKCIERHTEAASGQHKFAQPKATSKVLKPFSSVLFGASESVLAESIDPPDGIRAVVEKHGMQYVRAEDWKAWCADVSARSPSTLLLLPHSEESVKSLNVPALEISGHLHAIEGMEEDYVLGPDKRSPLVIVLGCSTGLTGVSFVNSISQFRKSGAAITVGTVALITGRQTVSFVQRFLDALRTAASQQMTFDEAYLQVKREMLAEGNPFVLSLVAYGDSGWELQV